VTADLLRSSVDRGPRDALICALKGTESYNWHKMRPLLNGLVVNIVAIWRHGIDPRTLEDIHRQQLSSWRQLADWLRQGATDFAQEGVVDPCGLPAAP
jgi:hypothetical protein